MIISSQSCGLALRNTLSCGGNMSLNLTLFSDTSSSTIPKHLTISLNKSDYRIFKQSNARNSHDFLILNRKW